MDYQTRWKSVVEQSAADVIALVPGANMAYFTGLHYHLSERPIVAFLSQAGAAFLVPALEESQLDQRADLPGPRFVWSDETGYAGAFRDAVQALGLERATLGVDGQTMRVFEWLALGEAGANLAGAQDMGQALLHARARKSADEIDALRAAVQLSERALERTLAQVQPGMSEVQVAQMLREELQTAGSEGNAFGPIVLFGTRSALPHGVPGEAVLQENDLLLIDFGGIKNGYPADITRTVCLGDPTDEMRRIHETVLQANAAARAAAQPGVSCHAVDKAARDVIAAAGYGDAFPHRTGHGLGLEVHELPNIAPNNDMRLEPGMVFTIEPGIYLPHIGGVRIEDNVVVTDDGIDTLTSYARDL